jgi:hypothetical protein
MSNYGENERKRERSRNPHPAWRGIGFLMMIGIPILSFAIADQVVIMLKSRGITIPAQLMTPPMQIPVYGVVVDLYAVLVFTAMITLVLFGLFAVINAAMYSSSSQNTYRVFESEPQKFKKKRKLVKPDYEK